MIYERNEIAAEGRKTGAAFVDWYLLDAISVEPGGKRPLILICPGGAYSFCCDREAEPVAMRFLAMGCHCGILNYSVAPNRFPTALLELAEAVAMAREKSGAWKIDPRRIYVCGFSAGGHLACSLGLFWNRPFVGERTGRTAEQIRPDGMILGYPVITAGRFAHRESFVNLLGTTEAEESEDRLLRDCRGASWSREQVSLELQVTPDAPKTFLWHTYADESVPVENSLLLASALRESGVSLEMHIYPKGRHGLSLANRETSGTLRPEMLEPTVQNWVDLVRAWVEENG